MVVLDEDALICDLAETYHIYNYRELPIETVATLAVGLRDTSRIKAKMSGLKTTLDVMLQSMTVDYLAMLFWFQSEDGAKGKNRPQSITAAILGADKKENDIRGFDSGDAFEEARKKLLGG